jgi:protein-tyrosine phosphatase
MHAVKTVLARSWLLCAAAALSMPLPPASAQEEITTPQLASDLNFRDLAGIAADKGGTGHADTTSNGGVMRTGVFYRSMALSGLSDADFATISSLHLVLDVDLRTPEEIATPGFPNGADHVPPGAAYVNINVVADNPSPPPSWDQAYRSFVTPAEAAQFGAVLRDIAHADGPVIWHCQDGKDRTGWTSMLLETIAGVPLGSLTDTPAPGTIMANYLASNAYLGVTLVYQTWLATGIADISQTWGSMDAYLRNGLGLTQADIYVLRAKMVYFPELPGQAAFLGNAAAGAAFLNDLQNSPLSGRYTAYNYYLQSAIDAGTLWGGEARAGGQVHADTASYLMRLPLWLDSAISAYAAGSGLRAGEGRMWVTGLADSFNTAGGSGNAGSSERSAGTIAGGTVRIGGQASATMGIGYNAGTVASAGATARTQTGEITIGGRYALSSLDAGPYVVARADAGWTVYESSRPLGGGLGTAAGATSGAIYSGLAGAGYVLRTAPFTVTAQTGFRFTGVALSGFTETGSELALDMKSASNESSSVLAGLDVALGKRQLYAWTIAPSLTFAYERMLSDPQPQSAGTLYGYTVRQLSAYDSRDLAKAGFDIAAGYDALTIGAKGYAVAGGLNSIGAGGQLSLRYNF